jgi:hypothetical protein
VQNKGGEQNKEMIDAKGEKIATDTSDRSIGSRCPHEMNKQTNPSNDGI